MTLTTLKDFLSEEKRAFDLLYGFAPPDSLKGKKSAQIQQFLEASHRRLLQRVVEMVKQQKLGSLPLEQEEWVNDLKDVHNKALDTIINLLKDI